MRAHTEDETESDTETNAANTNANANANTNTNHRGHHLCHDPTMRPDASYDSPLQRLAVLSDAVSLQVRWHFDDL